jgi:signal transduction histidine kinase
VLGDLLANRWEMIPVGAALGQTVGNVLEVLLGAYLLRRLGGRRQHLDTVVGVSALLLAIAAATSVSAVIGTLVNLAAGEFPARDVPRVMGTWWLGDTAGALIVTGLALTWYRQTSLDLRARRVVEAVGATAALVACSVLALHTSGPLSYLVFPALTWSALRFGPRGAAVAVAVTSSVAVWESAHRSGAFGVDSISRTTLGTQLYVLVAAPTTFFLAAVVAERAASMRGLAESRKRLVDVADRERRLLERDLHDGAQQRLTALALKIRLAAAQPPVTPEVLAEAGTELDSAIEELREIAHGIRPTVLTDLGLSNAIRSIAARSVLPITVDTRIASRFHETTEMTAYYVVAEAVANAQRYASARSIVVRAWGSLSLEIVDDGVGGAHEVSGGGLQGLRDRLEAVGGQLYVDSRRSGTRILAFIPATPLPDPPDGVMPAEESGSSIDSRG